MQRMVQQSETVELSRFPALRIRTMEIVHRLLHDCLGPAQKMIGNLIQIELAYINTSHPGEIPIRYVCKVEALVHYSNSFYICIRFHWW